MSKPSVDLRTLVGAKPSALRCWPHATFEAVVAELEEEATESGLDQKPWIAITIATVMTLGSPESVTAVAKHLVKTIPPSDIVAAVEFAREVGVIGMAMNGAPWTITMLTVFCESLPAAIRKSLRSTPSRHTNGLVATSTTLRGRTLWEQIHYPFADKVEQKFGRAHPDLPSLVVRNIYGDLFCNSVCDGDRTIGRVTTSLSAIAYLRAKSNCAPLDFEAQLFDHVCGFKNAWEDGSWKSEPGIGTGGAVEWLLKDEGCIWVLQKVDELSTALGAPADTPPSQCRSKL